MLDFGVDAFTGEARWLDIQVRCPSGSGTYAQLTPRQELTAVPYALGLRPGTQVQGSIETYSVLGVSNQGSGNGVYGETHADTDYVSAGVMGYSFHSNTFGVLGESDLGTGVEGRIINTNNANPAVTGWNAGSGEGVYGRSVSDFGIKGETLAAGFYENAGVYGYSVYSQTFGVLGESDLGTGVEGRITNTANTNPAITGYNVGGGDGVYGWSTGSGGSGIWGGTNLTDSFGNNGWNGSNGTGILGESVGGTGIQARSQSWRPLEAYGSSWDDVEFYVSNTGEVYADGTFHTPAADFAEMLPAQDDLEPGDVLVIGADGELALSKTAYATTVAGVYSTQPGFVGGAQEEPTTDEIPLAIVGVVPVKVSAENGTIQPGDLLTTSDTPGHAMKAEALEVNGVSFYPSGVILGKALEALDARTGVIQMLVTLQ
jgi:hypothetical protein